MTAGRRIVTGATMIMAALLMAACQPATYESEAAPVDYAASLSGPTEAFVEMWNSGDASAVDTIVSADFRRSAPDGELSGVEELKALVAQFHTAYPDMGIVADHVHYLEDTAIIRWTFSGTNTGPGEFEPTGNAVRVSGMTEARFAEGKIVLEDVYYDQLDMMEQLGFALSAPGS